MLCLLFTNASCSVMSDSVVTPWTVARQTPQSMGFSRQEYWSGLPFPPSGGLPDPGIEPRSPVTPSLAGGFFSTVPPGSPHLFLLWCISSVWKALPKIYLVDSSLPSERHYCPLNLKSPHNLKSNFFALFSS